MSDLSVQVTPDLRSEGDELDRVSESFFGSLAPLIPYDRIGVALVGPGPDTLTLRWARSKDGPGGLPIGYSAPLSPSLMRLLASGQTRIIDDLEVYLREHPDSHSTRALVRDGFRSSLSCALRASGRNVGVVFFTSRLPHTYSQEHELIYSLVASTLGSLIDRLQAQDRLRSFEAREAFLGTVLHDLRGPLTVIQLNADMILASEESGSSRIQRQVQSIRQQCANLERLIRDLELSRDLEDPTFIVEIRRLPLRPFLAKVQDAAEILVRSKSITFRMLDLTPPGEFLCADPQRLMQVLGNLIGNAIKFSGPHTEIELIVDVRGNELHFSLRDHGTGIPRSQLAGLFDRTRPRPREVPTLFERSSGLGLAISRKIVESHGGRIWAESEYGSGSVFHMSLPRESVARSSEAS